MNDPEERYYAGTIIYRGGENSRGNLDCMKRSKDGGKLSFRATISNPITARDRPVFGFDSHDEIDDFIGIDTTRLSEESVVRDDHPPGHITVTNVSIEALRDAVIAKWKKGVRC